MLEWKVDLNKVDACDNGPVFDYIESKIELNSGNATEPILRRYYDTLRRGGAEHVREL